MFLCLYDLPSWLLATLIIGGLVLASQGMVYLTHRLISSRAVEHVEHVSLFSSSSGVLYGVLLAMITVNAWDNLNKLQDVVDSEAFVIGDVYRESQGYPEDFRRELRGLLRRYVTTILNEEWPAMREGVANHSASNVMDLLVELDSQFQPGAQGTETVHNEVFRGLATISHYHRQLISGIDESVMPVLWGVVWIGALVNLFITALSTTGSPRMDYLLIGAYSFNIGLVIFLIFSLDHPMRGAITVNEDSFRYALTLMDHLDSKQPAR